MILEEAAKLLVDVYIVVPSSLLRASAPAHILDEFFHMSELGAVLRLMRRGSAFDLNKTPS